MDSLFLFEDDVLNDFNPSFVPLESHRLNEARVESNYQVFPSAINALPIDIPKRSSYSTYDGFLSYANSLSPSYANSVSPSYANSDDLSAWFDELAVRSPSAGSFYSHRMESPSSPVCFSQSFDIGHYLSPNSYPSPLPFGKTQDVVLSQDLELFPTVVLPPQPQPDLKSTKRTKVHQCPFCSHTSNRANNMREHTQIHNPNRPKPFCCKICSRAFARKHDMKRHYLSCKKTAAAAAAVAAHPL
ncbi:hypothetical protein BY458DRAFT_515281 [Sporodiniella umbellata]|nr:hypothetical protein BY458DRAFT_515281 [Sporodiniella umbellata]